MGGEGKGRGVEREGREGKGPISKGREEREGREGKKEGRGGEKGFGPPMSMTD